MKSASRKKPWRRTSQAQGTSAEAGRCQPHRHVVPVRIGEQPQPDRHPVEGTGQARRKALMSCKAARAIKQALLDANPTGPREQINLANVDLETGDSLRLIGQSVEARASFEEAVFAIIERLNNTRPRFADQFVVVLQFGLKGLGATQRTANQTADAVASWRRAIAMAERLRSPSNELLFYLAGCHARLGAVAGVPRSGLSASEGQAELDRAMVRLRQAIAGGSRNVNSMKRDLDLEPLHRTARLSSGHPGPRIPG